MIEGLAILLSGFLNGLIWSLMASLFFFGMERGHIFDFFRHWIIKVITMHKDGYIYYDRQFKELEELTFQERAQAYLDKYYEFAIDSKLAVLFLCQTCFTTQFAVWISLFSGIYFLEYFQEVLIYCTGFILTSYYLSFKV
jgi:hypothetical protein